MTQLSFSPQIIRVHRDGTLLIAGYQWLEEKSQPGMDTGLLDALLTRWLSSWMLQTVKVLFTVDGQIHVPLRPSRWKLPIARMFKRNYHLPVKAEKRAIAEIQSIGSATLRNRAGNVFMKNGTPQYRVVIYFHDGGWCDVAHDIAGEDQARLISVQLQNAWAEMAAAINSMQAKASHRKV